MRKLTLLLLVIFSNVHFARSEDKSNVYSFKPGSFNTIPIPSLKSDPKIDCVPKNTQWQAIRTLDNTPALNFSFSDLGTYTFIVASNENSKTILQVIVVKIKTNPDDPDNPPSPNPSPNPNPPLPAPITILNLQEEFDADNGTQAQRSALLKFFYETHTDLSSKTPTIKTLEQFGLALKEQGKTIDCPRLKAKIKDDLTEKFPNKGPIPANFIHTIAGYWNSINNLKLKTPVTYNAPPPIVYSNSPTFYSSTTYRQSCPTGNCPQ